MSRTMRKPLAHLLVGAAVALICAVGASPVSAASQTAKASTQPVQLLGKAQASQLLHADRYQRPTLVVLWSTECSYCKRNLQWLKARPAGKTRFDLITVATQPMSQAVDQVLAKHKLSGQHWAYGSDLPEAVSYALDADWAGELPRSYLFNGRGGRQVLSGVLTDATLEQAWQAMDSKLPR